MLLPLVLGGKWFTWQAQDYLEVPIVHPEADWSGLALVRAAGGER